MTPEAKYDPTVDALYVRLSSYTVCKTIDFSIGRHSRIVDFDHEGDVIGVEFLNCKKFGVILGAIPGVDAEELERLIAPLGLPIGWVNEEPVWQKNSTITLVFT